MSDVLQKEDSIKELDCASTKPEVAIYSAQMGESAPVKLGKAFRVGSKATAYVTSFPRTWEFNVPHVDVLVKIGESQVAHILMTKDAFDALNEGQPVTFNNFKK